MDQEEKEMTEAEAIDDVMGVFDPKRFRSDSKELEVIANALPKDGVFDIENIFKLQRLCLRGMNICDYWCKILQFMLGREEGARDAAKNHAYISAALPGVDRLTAELRKSVSEINTVFIAKREEVSKLKAIKTYFDNKKESFVTASFFLNKALDITFRTNPASPVGEQRLGGGEDDFEKMVDSSDEEADEAPSGRSGKMSWGKKST